MFREYRLRFDLKMIPKFNSSHWSKGVGFWVDSVWRRLPTEQGIIA
jgi:hypothetical protein